MFELPELGATHHSNVQEIQDGTKSIRGERFWWRTYVPKGPSINATPKPRVQQDILSERDPKFLPTSFWLRKSCSDKSAAFPYYCDADQYLT